MIERLFLKDAGCCARVFTWFTEDETGPHPELDLMVGKNLANLARPHRNCLVVSFEDHSGHEGPTGTVIDGPLNFAAKTLDDLITSTILPVDEDDNGEIDPLFQKIFGTAPKKPWAIYRDGQHSGIIESGYHQQKGPTRTTMTGGRSPKIVNDLQTFQTMLLQRGDRESFTQRIITHERTGRKVDHFVAINLTAFPVRSKRSYS
jgi:hypothetical protein